MAKYNEDGTAKKQAGNKMNIKDKFRKNAVRAGMLSLQLSTANKIEIENRMRANRGGKKATVSRKKEATEQ